MAQVSDSLVRKVLAQRLRLMWLGCFIAATGGLDVVFPQTANAFLPVAASSFQDFAPAFENARKPGDSPAAIAYTFSVDKIRPAITDSLIYSLAVWNDPLLADTLRGVEAEFFLPRLQNGSFALLPATFRYGGAYPLTIDLAQGMITWQLGDIVRHTPRLPSDTVRVVFSFHLADVSAFALLCGENPLTAFARVSFLDPKGQRIYPGTQRAAESTLLLTPDFVATGVASAPPTVQRGDTLMVTYSYHNAGNVGRNVTLCLQAPNGLSLAGVRVEPDTLRLQLFLPDSLCVDLGFVPAGHVGEVKLRLPIEQNLPAEVDSLCLRGALVTDCDREPANNFYNQTCTEIAPLDLLAVTKTAERNLVEVGDTLSYTIRFENVDTTVTAWNVMIADVLPLGVDLIFADTSYTFANGVLSWQRGQLRPRQSDTLRFSVRIRPDFFATQSPNSACLGARTTNFVNITSTAPDGSPSPESPDRLANNSSTATSSIAPLGDLLEITQTVTAITPANLANLLPGDTLQYVLEYGNRNTRLSANNVTVIDSLPDQRSVQLLLPPPSGFVYDVANHVLRRENFSLAPNESATASFRLVLRNSNALCASLNLNNRARISEPANLDCRLENNFSSSNVTLAAQQNLLRLIVQVPNTVAPNGTVDVILNYSNRSDLTLTNVVARNVLPYPLNVLAINDGGALVAANQIEWQLGALAPRVNGSVSSQAQVRDSSFCAPLAIQNFAWLNSEPRDCDTSDDTSRSAITISASAPEDQPRLLVQSVQLIDANNDGCAEPGERIVAHIRFVNQNNRNITARQIRFIDPRAVLSKSWPMTLLDLSPLVIAANDSGVATFEFVIGENDFAADTIAFAGAITAENFCPQSFDGLVALDLRFCPQPQVVLTRVDINDDGGNRDGFASEGETLNLIVVYQNLGPLDADSVDATITISLPGFTFLQANRPAINTLPLRLRTRLAAGQRDSVFIQLRYDNSAPSEQLIVLSSFLQVSAIAGPQPAVSDQIPIRRDCFARPNPFIPSRHPSGVRFAPNDDESVAIFDTQGNLMRALRASQFWDGKDERGRLCEPGLYIWKITNACQGTIVLVR